jgi:signal transduction histidine kinase
MRSLYLRIYLTVVAVLALFALVSGWMVQRHLDGERSRIEAVAQERMAAWGDLLQRSLPGPDAPVEEQARALTDWSQRLRVPLALDDATGRRIAVSDSFARRELQRPESLQRLIAIPLDDGRTLWVSRFNPRRLRQPPGMNGEAGHEALHRGLRDQSRGEMLPQTRGADARAGVSGQIDRERAANADLPPGTAAAWSATRWLPDGLGLVLLLGVLFLAVAAGAFPVVRRLTRRLEDLKQGVEAFGAGQLQRRVSEDGRDEVAAVGASFNRAATRIEALLRSHQSLLANASHELRSPLARLKMAVQMLEDASPAQRGALRREIDANIGELDALVEEVLLASRLDAGYPPGTPDKREPVDLLALAAEEAARVGASAQGEDLQVQGDERLLRRALRNLFENAQRYGQPAGPESAAVVASIASIASAASTVPGDADDGADTPIQASVHRVPGGVELRVCDRGPGVPEAYRERIFEAFFRMPGHAEREGGVGLGLALVRQIAQRHGGTVKCEARTGGGSCFVLSLPLR